MSDNNGSREILVSTAWVAERLSDPQVHLIEVDEDTDAYGRGHIPGAIALHWKYELQDRVRRNFVDQPTFEALLSRRGITENDTVVLYGGNNNWFAAYAYWYFRLYGHQKVKLLDGGRKKWELESREIVTDVPRRPATSYHAAEQDTAIRAFRDEVLSAIGRRNL